MSPQDSDAPPRIPESPDRNLALELVRVTEAAALSAGRFVGRGDKNGGDGAAVDAMRTLIGSVSMRGVVVIGEGEKDEAPMLYNGEEVGNGDGPDCDVAVDPGGRHDADGQGHAQRPGRPRGRRARRHVRPVGRVLHGEAGRRRRLRRRGRHRPPGPREPARGGQGEGRRGLGRLGGHPRPPAPRPAGPGGPRRGCPHPLHLRQRRRGRDRGGAAGQQRRHPARHRRHSRGDHRGVRAGLHGGSFQGRLWPRDDEEREKAQAAGHDLDRVLLTGDLVRGDNIFFCATGVTDGDLLRGVHYRSGGASTQSLVMRSKSGTVRLIDGWHRLSKLRQYSAVDYGSEGYQESEDDLPVWGA